jgi:subtilisin-like proprotein convertase family protein
VKVLRDQTGGSAHDLHESYTLTAAELGSTDPRGDWTLKIVDRAAADVGTIDSVKLSFQE